ncbi:MAG: aryl-alcohol dehydrogenase [Ilumatobacteraceae bacterium]|nr:aryl-alcohol dehydrogenase [Ilumatobacteraceae bacterium]
MKVTAAVLRESTGAFQIEELELGEPNADEVVVRMVATGVCHTDLLSRELPPELFMSPIVFGHEGAGVVAAVGADVHHVVIGDQVVLSFDSCGSCPSCTTDNPSGCYNFNPLNLKNVGIAPGRLDGTSSFTDAHGHAVGSHFFGQSSFASHSIVSGRSAVKVDKSMALEALGPLGCGVQTGAGAIMNTLAVQAGSSVVILGAGSLGLSAVMAAKVVGASTIIAVDKYQSRLDLARHYGATHGISGSLDEITSQIMSITGAGADHAFDTTGNAALVRAAFESLTFVGTLGMAGVGSPEMTFGYTSLITGRKVMGVVEGSSRTHEFIPYLAQLNAEGSFPFDELITYYPIEQINEAAADSLSGKVVKPVVRFA